MDLQPNVKHERIRIFGKLEGITWPALQRNTHFATLTAHEEHGGLNFSVHVAGKCRTNLAEAATD